MLTTPDKPPAPPPDPTPRQLLVVAELVAAGESELTATLRAGLAPETWDRLKGDAVFAAVLAECQATEARPVAERDAVLRRLLRRAIERALAEGRVGAIAAAMRLLDEASSPPPPPARRRLPGPAASAAGEGDEGDEGDGDSDAAAVTGLGGRWGIEADGAGGWRGADGRPAMPGRQVALHEAPGGPVRLVDTGSYRGVDDPAFLAMLDGMDEAQTLSFNRSAYPFGGAQWNPRNRTLWRWDGPGSGATRSGLRLPTGPASGDDDDEDDDDRVGVERPGLPALPSPPPPPPASPSPREELRRRLDGLLARGSAPATPAEADLAEAVCALIWPNWPPYAGAIDLRALREVLAVTPVHPRQLALLGGRGPP